MRPGPPPKPRALRILEGDAGKQLGKQKHPPTPAPGPLGCPAYLDKYGREEWKRIVSQALAMGYAATDVSTLAMACDSYATWRRARAKCADRVVKETTGEGDAARTVPVTVSGLVYESGANGLVTSPWFRIAEESKRAYLRFVGELGLSPAARTRIEVDPAQVFSPTPKKKANALSDAGPTRFFSD